MRASPVSAFSAAVCAGTADISSRRRIAIKALGDGSALPSHGDYASADEPKEFALGGFFLTDWPIADFTSAFLTSSEANADQINVYEPTVIGDFAGLHVGANDHIAVKPGPNPERGTPRQFAA